MGNKQALYKIRGCMETYLLNMDVNVAVSERLNLYIKCQLKIEITIKYGLEDLYIRNFIFFMKLLHLYLLAVVVPIAEQCFALKFVLVLVLHVAQVPFLIYLYQCVPKVCINRSCEFSL